MESQHRWAQMGAGGWLQAAVRTVVWRRGSEGGAPSGTESNGLRQASNGASDRGGGAVIRPVRCQNPVLRARCTTAIPAQTHKERKGAGAGSAVGLVPCSLGLASGTVLNVASSHLAALSEQGVRFEAATMYTSMCRSFLAVSRYASIADRCIKDTLGCVGGRYGASLYRDNSYLSATGRPSHKNLLWTSHHDNSRLGSIAAGVGGRSRAVGCLTCMSIHHCGCELALVPQVWTYEDTSRVLFTIDT